MLIRERKVPVTPTPFAEACEDPLDARLACLRAHTPTTSAGPTPVHRETEEVERGPHRGRMTPVGALEPEVYEAGFGRMEFKPIPAKPLAQHAQQSLAGQVVLEGHHCIIGISDQKAPALQPWSRHGFQGILPPGCGSLLAADGGVPEVSSH